MRTDDGSWAGVQGKRRNCSSPPAPMIPVSAGAMPSEATKLWTGRSPRRPAGSEALVVSLSCSRSGAELEVSRFVLETVQQLPLHRELNLRRTPDSSERREGGNTAGSSTGHGTSRRNYAAARLRYAAASAIGLSKCAAVAGVAAVRPGLRRRSSKYAAAAMAVKQRSSALAGNRALSIAATERGV